MSGATPRAGVLIVDSLSRSAELTVKASPSKPTALDYLGLLRLLI